MVKDHENLNKGGLNKLAREINTERIGNEH